MQNKVARYALALVVDAAPALAKSSLRINQLCLELIVPTPLLNEKILLLTSPLYRGDPEHAVDIWSNT